MVGGLSMSVLRACVNVPSCEHACVSLCLPVCVCVSVCVCGDRECDHYFYVVFQHVALGLCLFVCAAVSVCRFLCLLSIDR